MVLPDDDVIPASKHVAVLILVMRGILLSASVGGCIYYIFMSYLKTLTVAQRVSCMYVYIYIYIYIYTRVVPKVMSNNFL